MAAQLALYDTDRRVTPDVSRTPERRRPYAGRVRSGVARIGHLVDRRTGVVLCQSCHAREARYGFHPEQDDPQVDRPRTLCFECFRLEMGRRQQAAREVQVRLPLDKTLDALHRRRRRAQIAARKALGL